ncbi:MAG: endonuclease III [Candidatus Heimdallarchaeota archaeon]|nr:endonuclease III [Candidatus Heimdallarchaeota archaeon]
MRDRVEQVKEIIRKLHLEYPNSRCSLDFSNPYELLVGTILSAQSTDKRVNIVLPGLLGEFSNARSMADGQIDDIKEHIKSVGLYNNKAKQIKKMSEMISDEYGGNVPSDMKELIKLPGVGRKTANVVLGNAFGVPDSGIAVDTHVIRMTQRMGLTTNKDAVKIERDLMNLVPRNEWVDFTHLFIDHGRKICVKKPKCEECVLKSNCDQLY